MRREHFLGAGRIRENSNRVINGQLMTHFAKCELIPTTVILDFASYFPECQLNNLKTEKKRSTT